MTFQKNIGMLCLAAYLILTGLAAVFKLGFEGMAIIMGILALSAGILILIGR